MVHHQLRLLASCWIVWLLLDSSPALASGGQPSTQNYGSFSSSSGLDQDGGLQPAVGGYFLLV